MSDLIAEAAAHIANAADSIPPGSTRAAMLRGEGADDRLSLLVRLTKALSQQSKDTQAMKDYGDRAVVKLNKARFALRDVLAAFSVQDEGELSYLPVGTIIRDANGDVHVRTGNGVQMAGAGGNWSLNWVKYPAVIVYTPPEEEPA